MTFHQDLADGRWKTLTLAEQLANVGGEISRALRWRQKENEAYAMRALERALELLYLTIDDERHRGRLRELTRLRETLLDYFLGPNDHGSTEETLMGYFDAFAYAARLSR